MDACKNSQTSVGTAGHFLMEIISQLSVNLSNDYIAWYYLIGAIYARTIYSLTLTGLFACFTAAF